MMSRAQARADARPRHERQHRRIVQRMRSVERPAQALAVAKLDEEEPRGRHSPHELVERRGEALAGVDALERRAHGVGLLDGREVEAVDDEADVGPVDALDDVVRLLPSADDRPPRDRLVADCDVRRMSRFVDVPRTGGECAAARSASARTSEAIRSRSNETPRR